MIKFCKECGKAIENPHNGQKYHHECALIVRKRHNSRSKKSRYTDELKKLKQPSVSIDEIIKLAMAEGMQYGQYCLKHKLY